MRGRFCHPCKVSNQITGILLQLLQSYEQNSRQHFATLATLCPRFQAYKSNCHLPSARFWGVIFLFSCTDGWQFWQMAISSSHPPHTKSRTNTWGQERCVFFWYLFGSIKYYPYLCNSKSINVILWQDNSEKKVQQVFITLCCVGLIVRTSS